MSTRWRRLVGPLLVALLAGCARAEPLVMKAVELGRGVDGEGRIVEPTRTFTPRDTVSASIATEGAGSATLTVEWWANTTVFAKESRAIAPNGPALFAFQAVPADGWPAGRSQLVFYFDPREKHAAAFEVR